MQPPLHPVAFETGEAINVSDNVGAEAEWGRTPGGQRRPTSVGLLMGPFSLPLHNTSTTGCRHMTCGGGELMAPPPLTPGKANGSNQFIWLEPVKGNTEP